MLVASFEATAASSVLGSVAATAQETGGEEIGIEDADDGVLEGEDLSEGTDGDVEVDPTGEASSAGASQQAPPQQQGGIPREVFEKLLQASSTSCRKELEALVESQGESGLSEECNAEASATMARVRREMGDAPPSGSAGAPQEATAEGSDEATTQALIVIAFFGIIIVGVSVAVYTTAAKLPAAKPLTPEEAEKRRKAEEKAAAKRKRKGLPPKQPGVDVY